MKDPDNKPNELTWTITGNKKLKADISPSRILTVSAPDKYFWCAPETMTLTVKDQDGASASQTITFEITSLNDAPVMKDIPGQKIKEKGEFKDIDLTKYVRCRQARSEESSCQEGRQGQEGQGWQVQAD